MSYQQIADDEEIQMRMEDASKDFGKLLHDIDQLPKPERLVILKMIADKASIQFQAEEQS